MLWAHASAAANEDPAFLGAIISGSATLVAILGGFLVTRWQSLAAAHEELSDRETWASNEEALTAKAAAVAREELAVAQMSLLFHSDAMARLALEQGPLQHRHMVDAGFDWIPRTLLDEALAEFNAAYEAAVTYLVERVQRQIHHPTWVDFRATQRPPVGSWDVLWIHVYGRICARRTREACEEVGREATESDVGTEVGAIEPVVAELFHSQIRLAEAGVRRAELDHMLAVRNHSLARMAIASTRPLSRKEWGPPVGVLGFLAIVGLGIPVGLFITREMTKPAIMVGVLFILGLVLLVGFIVYTGKGPSREAATFSNLTSDHEA